MKGLFEEKKRIGGVSSWKWSATPSLFPVSIGHKQNITSDLIWFILFY